MADQKYLMEPPDNPATKSEHSEPTDPFAGAGFSDYPSCRLATSLEPATSARRQQFSLEELARLDRMKSPQRQLEMEASFALRRKLIGELAECRPEDVKLGTSEDGAPRLERPSGWALSLANKGATTVIAMAPEPANIGVDLEFVRALDWPPMLNMVSKETERASFKQVFAERDDCTEAFLRLWTIKEAVLKATQRGFRAGPKGVETPPSILAGPGQGQLSAFGERYEFWTTRSGDALISLARKRD